MNHIIIVGLLLLMACIVRAQYTRTNIAPAVTADHSQLIKSVLQAKPNHRQDAKMGGVGLELKGIYIDSGLLWFVFRGVNHSAIDFHPAAMHLSIRDEHTLKRRAMQEQPLISVIRYEPALLSADSTVEFCYALAPRIPAKRQQVFIEWMERNGDRRLELRVSAKAILTARRLVAVAHKN